MKKETVCDFCASEDTAERQERIGDWCACETCAALAAADDIDGLVKRSISLFTRKRMLPLGEGFITHLYSTYRLLLLETHGRKTIHGETRA